MLLGLSTMLLSYRLLCKIISRLGSKSGEHFHCSSAAAASDYEAFFCSAKQFHCLFACAWVKESVGVYCTSPALSSRAHKHK